MAQNPNILSPREALVDNKGVVTRSWWRFFNALGQNSGTLAQGVTIAPNSVITPGTINAGSTVTPADIPKDTLLGNSTGGDAPASPQQIGPSLELNNGKLAVASIPGGTLSGNGGIGPAPPGAIIVSTGLSLSGNMLTAVPTPGGAPNLALVEALAYWNP